MKFLIAVALLFLSGIKQMNAQVNSNICQQSIAVLKNAVNNGETFFIKVHAAENLIAYNMTEGLEAKFLQLRKESPDYLIGSARVLARLNKHQPEKYQQCLKELLHQFETGSTSKLKLTALESLGKLGYHEALPIIKAYADTGSNGFKAMARWILSNSGKEVDENRLSEMLSSSEPLDYRYAAYTLRFKSTANKQTIECLKNCLQNLKIDDVARVYVASSLFVHASAEVRKSVKPLISFYLSGDVGQRYEAAEALGLAGSKNDLPALQKLLTDESTDVQVAAANAIFKLMNCEK
jgi:hypothetical protein